MSNSAKLEELLTAVDQATRPFKSLQTETLSLSDSVKGTEKNLRGLYTQLAQVDEIRRAEKALASVNARLGAIKQHKQNVANGTAEPAVRDPWGPKPKSERALKKERLTLRRTIKDNKISLKTAGIQASTPLSARLQLNSRISDESAQLIIQRQALKQEQDQKRQQRAAKIQAVQQRLLGAGEKASAISAKGKSIATTGFELGKKIMQPGFEASLKNSPLAPAATSDNAEAGVQNNAPAAGTAVATLQNNSGTAVATLQNSASAPGSAVATLQNSASAPGTAVATLQNSASAPGTSVAAIQNSAAGPEAAMQSSVGNLGTDLEALQAAYQSLSVDIFSTQESSLRSLVQTATSFLLQLQQWVQDNQGLVQSFGLIATVVVGVAGAIGTVAGVIAPVFTGLSALITIATTVGSVLTTVFTAVAGVIAAVGWPVTLIVALIVGAAALIYTHWERIVSIFNKVRDTFNSVKEKLGFGGEKETSPSSTADATSDMVSGNSTYIQPTSSMTGYQNYQAARPAAGGSYVDQSKSEYNITLQGDMSPGGDGARQLKDLLAQHEQEKRTNSLSQFSAAGGYA